MAEQPEAAPRFRFEPLSSAHDRTAFSCGVPVLDNYLHKQAGQDSKKHAAVVFVMTMDGKNIVGYYTLSQYSVRLDEVPQQIATKLPKYPYVSATLLGRLAIDRRFQGQKLGSLVLMDALYRCLRASNEIASAGVVVDAKDASATAFYKKFGFLELPNIERRLFLPMRTIQKMFVD